MPAANLHKFSYLVVDDDALAHDVLGNTLTFIGATQVFFAQDAASALHLAQKNRPDFVLLDIYMPGTDGWALLAKLRRVLPHAAMLMVTGSICHADFTQSMEQEVDGFCIKPVMPDVLKKALVRAHMRRQKT